MERSQATGSTRGPQEENRQLSEDRLKRRILAFLTGRSPALQGVKVTVIGTTVLLRGELPSAYAKWLCLECCNRVAGVRQVIDELSVAGEAQSQVSQGPE